MRRGFLSRRILASWHLKARRIKAMRKWAGLIAGIFRKRKASKTRIGKKAP